MLLLICIVDVKAIPSELDAAVSPYQRFANHPQRKGAMDMSKKYSEHRAHRSRRKLCLVHKPELPPNDPNYDAANQKE